MMMMMFVFPSPRCVGLYILREIGQSAWSSLNRQPKNTVTKSVITDVMKDVIRHSKNRVVAKANYLILFYLPSGVSLASSDSSHLERAPASLLRWQILLTGIF